MQETERPADIARQIAELGDQLALTDAVRVSHLERRVAALQRQLELRISQVADARRERDDLQRELGLVRAKAEEHDRLLATKTMRALRLPRAAYARFVSYRRR